MSRTFRTLTQSIASPVLSTILYFIVFGSAIGSRIENIDGLSYSAFIVSGLIMLTILNQSVSNASFGIYFPKFSGTIYEIFLRQFLLLKLLLVMSSSPASKSMIVGLIILFIHFLLIFKSCVSNLDDFTSISN